MRISVLTENNAGQVTAAEHGLSYLIETDGKRILFDTGQSDLFLRNAAIMRVSLKEIDMIILSHGHFDHGDGSGAFYYYRLRTCRYCQHDETCICNYRN